jgi:F-type H+-transporting ATPase subunit gamma
MLRSTISATRRATVAPQLNRVPARGFASEQQLKLRIGTVSNVKKITSTMKMVAAAKLRGAQRVLDVARVFASVTEAWPTPEVEVSADKKHLVVAIASDKGLCGGINSSIVRAVRDSVRDHKKEGKNDVDIVIFGNKGVQGLERLFAEKFHTSITDNYKANFTQSCEQAAIMNAVPHETGEMWFQYFRSMMSYDTTKVPMQSFEAATAGGAILPGYARQGHPLYILENFHAFKSAVNLFLCQCETETATLSSRMAAMEGSSKNAGEMLDALTLQLNRSRQQRITTELIEIISGASAAEEQQG